MSLVRIKKLSRGEEEKSRIVSRQSGGERTYRKGTSERGKEEKREEEKKRERERGKGSGERKSIPKEVTNIHLMYVETW